MAEEKVITRAEADVIYEANFMNTALDETKIYTANGQLDFDLFIQTSEDLFKEVRPNKLEVICNLLKVADEQYNFGFNSTINDPEKLMELAMEWVLEPEQYNEYLLPYFEFRLTKIVSNYDPRDIYEIIVPLDYDVSDAELVKLFWAFTEE